MNRAFPNLQNVNAELTQLNVNQLGQDQTLADRGTGTGSNATYGVSLDGDSTNALGGIGGDTGSDQGMTAKGCYTTPGSTSQAPGQGDAFNGSMGRFSGASDAPDEENINDSDAGARD